MNLTPSLSLLPQKSQGKPPKNKEPKQGWGRTPAGGSSKHDEPAYSDDEDFQEVQITGQEERSLGGCSSHGPTFRCYHLLENMKIKSEANQQILNDGNDYITLF